MSLLDQGKLRHGSAMALPHCGKMGTDEKLQIPLITYSITLPQEELDLT